MAVMMPKYSQSMVASIFAIISIAIISIIIIRKLMAAIQGLFAAQYETLR